MHPFCSSSINSRELSNIINSHFQERRNALLNLMKFDGKFNVDFISYYDKWWKLTPENEKCLCERFVKGQTNFQFNKEAIGKGGVGQAFLISLPVNQGSDERQSYVVKLLMKEVNDCPYLSVRFTEVTIEDVLTYMNPSMLCNLQIGSLRNQSISESHSDSKLDENDNKKYNMTVSCDDFSNQTCMHMILDIILGKYYHNDNFIYQYDAFVCKDPKGKNVAYTVMDKADGDLNKYFRYLEESISGVIDRFDSSTGRNKSYTSKLTLNFSHILIDVFTPLKILKQLRYGFVHADLKTQNIFYSGDLEDDNLKFMIADYDKSSIYFNSVRFYNGTRDSNLKDMISNYPKLESVGKMMNGKYRDIQYYRMNSLGGTTNKIMGVFGANVPWWQLNIMYSSYGFYLSHDIYTFMLSLAGQQLFWGYINDPYDREKESTYDSSDKYKRITKNDIIKVWNSLWIDEEDKFYVTKFIYDLHKNRDTHRLREWNINEINAFLIESPVKLKFDLSEIYDILGISIPEESLDPFNLMNKHGVVISHKGKLCLTGKCDEIVGKNKICKTNRYSVRGKIYDYDNC